MDDITHMISQCSLSDTNFYYLTPDHELHENFFKFDKANILKYMSVHQTMFKNINNLLNAQDGLHMVLANGNNDVRYFQFHKHKIKSLLCAQTDYEWMTIDSYYLHRKGSL